MFVGHYTASFIAKGLEPKASLALFFIAAQFLDFIFFGLVLVGGESLTMTANATASTHFELPFMPFSHSIWTSLLWSAAVFSVSLKILKLGRNTSILLACVVMSHWCFDLIVHTPDLAVWNIFSEDAIKWGFGLWNNAIVAFALECGLLTIAIIFYAKRTSTTDNRGKYSILFYWAFLISIQAINTFGGLVEESVLVFAWQALILFTLLALVSGYVDRQRRN